VNDAIRPRASSRFDVLPDLLPETDATPLGPLTWSDLFAAPQTGETDDVAVAARLVQHLDGALTHPVDEDEPRAEAIPHDGIVPARFASALGDPANATATRDPIPSADAARPEAEQRRSDVAPARGAEAGQRRTQAATTSASATPLAPNRGATTSSPDASESAIRRAGESDVAFEPQTRRAIAMSTSESAAQRHTVSGIAQPPLTLAERAFLRDARPVPSQDRARLDAREAEQTLRITIGRIRVEAPASPSAPSRTPPARPKPHISLAEYSRQRGSEL
jgi:hypothetical protein